VTSTGTVRAIHIAPAAGVAMVALSEADGIAGVGLAGDRYALGTGHWSADPRVDREVTLIEDEQVDQLRTAHGVDLRDGELRRNLTTVGIDLNALVGKRFRIGTMLLEGTRLCEPCVYLQGLVGKPVLAPLVHHGGLRARILESGHIALDDVIVVVD